MQQLHFCLTATAESTAQIQSTLSTEPLAKAATVIQRLWRGQQTRRKLALTLPSLLELQTRHKLLSPISPPWHEIENKLFAVHATDFFPMDGIIRVVDPKARGGGSYFRPTTHFALGELVRPQCDGKITRELKKFAIITPLKDLMPQLLNIYFYDTYILGDFKLTKDSIVLAPSGEAKSFQELYPHLNIVSYDLSKGLRQAVKDTIRERGGFSITLSANDEKQGACARAVFESQSENLNTPEFFAPILRRNRNVAFGWHCSSVFGSSYLLGVIDNALTQLGFSPDYYGYIYNEDSAFSKLLIQYALERVAKSIMINADFPGSDVLKLHITRAKEGLDKITVSRERKSFSGDYTKARIVQYFTWADLLLLMHTNKRLALHISNKSAFLCMYAYYRTCVIGENAAKNEGILTVFSHHLSLLTQGMFRAVMGTILAIRSNQEEQFKAIFPGGEPHLKRLIIRTAEIAEIAEIVFEQTNDLEKMANEIWKHPSQPLPTTIDLADGAGNVPLVQAIIAKDEQKALSLLKAGANIIDVVGNVADWNLKVPLLSLAIRSSMPNFAETLLKHPDFLALDQLDGWHNTPLCDAIMMGLEKIAIYLIERGARVDRRPNYVGVPEQDLLSLANKKGLVQVATLLREHGCVSQVMASPVSKPMPPVSNPENRSGCSIM